MSDGAGASDQPQLFTEPTGASLRHRCSFIPKKRGRMAGLCEHEWTPWSAIGGDGQYRRDCLICGELEVRDTRPDQDPPAGGHSVNGHAKN